MLKSDTYVSERAAHKTVPTEGWSFLAGVAILALAYLFDWALPVKFFGLMWILLGAIPLMGEQK
jgi:hypothetical protein